MMIERQLQHLVTHILGFGTAIDRLFEALYLALRPQSRNAGNVGGTIEL